MQANDTTFRAWWPRVSMAVARADRKDINSLIILMARSSWIEETVRFFF
jgi:hypothetical protein